MTSSTHKKTAPHDPRMILLFKVDLLGNALMRKFELLLTFCWEIQEFIFGDVVWVGVLLGMGVFCGVLGSNLLVK